ncbi:MAG: V4R domain-containing protein [Candidatus Methylomirabilia bacterium]
MENTILRDLVYDARSGCLTFKGTRYLLIRPETIVALHKAVEADLGDRAGHLLVQGGRTGGALSARRYRETFNLDTRQVVEFMVRMGREIGWGEFALEHLDQEHHELVISVGRSPFAEAYGPSGTSVCHLIAGVVGGLAEGVFEGPVVVSETACVAAGGPRCRFEARGTGPLNERGSG